MRILVSGSRSWDRPDVIWSCLDILTDEAFKAGDDRLTVVHGACPKGADQHADEWVCERARLWPIRAERHPANWAERGRRAGFLRNQAMVSLGADLVLAFLWDGSPGTRHCIEAAERAGLIVQVVQYEDLPAEVAR